jgi:hypothetical protein
VEFRLKRPVVPVLGNLKVDEAKVVSEPSRILPLRPLDEPAATHLSPGSSRIADRLHRACTGRPRPLPLGHKPVMVTTNPYIVSSSSFAALPT